MIASHHTEHFPVPPVAPPRLALIVDSDPHTRELCATALVPRRYIVEQARDGREALARAIAQPPDVILMEVSLPGMNGVDLCELLRRDPDTSRIPILVFTADVGPESHQRMRAAGADFVLVKPCPPGVLVSRVDEAIERARAHHDLGPTPRMASNGAREKRLSHTLRRYQTTMPPATPPPLLCPTCLDVLEFERSFVGGVTQKFAEQWDELTCRHGCGAFQYRHRTRKLSRVPAAQPPR